MVGKKEMSLDDLKYFSREELKCQATGDEGMDVEFMLIIDKMRDELGFPFPVNSGYRSPEHPIEARKERPGAHATGKAIDIGVSGGQALALIECAQKHGISRIGIQQKGAMNGRFIHLDVCENYTSPAIWSY